MRVLHKGARGCAPRENDTQNVRYIRDAPVWIFEVTTQDEEQRSRKEQRAGRAVSNMSAKLQACVTMLPCRFIDAVVNDESMKNPLVS